MSTAERRHLDFFLPQQRQLTLRCSKERWLIYPLAIKGVNVASWDVNIYFADDSGWDLSEVPHTVAEQWLSPSLWSHIIICQQLVWLCSSTDGLGKKYHQSLVLLNLMTEFPQTLAIVRPKSNAFLTLMSCHNSLAANRSLTSGIGISKHANSSLRNKPLSKLLGRDTEDTEGADVGCYLSNNLYLVGIWSRRSDPWQKCLNV